MLFDWLISQCCSLFVWIDETVEAIFGWLIDEILIDLRF